MFSLFLLVSLFLRTKNDFQKQVPNMSQMCSLCFHCFLEQKIVFENCIQTCPNTMVFAFLSFFFFGSTFVCLLQFEQKRGHVASVVECYMNQYGVYEEQTYNKFQKQIENGWLVLGKTIKYNCFKNDISLFVCQNRFNKKLSQQQSQLSNNKSTIMRQQFL